MTGAALVLKVVIEGESARSSAVGEARQLARALKKGWIQYSDSLLAWGAIGAGPLADTLCATSDPAVASEGGKPEVTADTARARCSIAG